MLLALLLTLAPALAARAGEALILLSPDGLYYAPATINVKIQCVSDDDHFPKTVYLYLDDVLLRTSACDVPDYVLNLPRGQYVLRTNAVDVQGNNLNEQLHPFDVLIPGDLPPSVTLHPITGGPYSAPATIPLSVTATDSDGQVVSVEYFANSQLIGTTTTAPFSFTWSGVAAGSYSVMAKATDNNGKMSPSQPRTVTVEPMSVPGQIEGVRDNGAGGFDAYGWACLAGTSASIDVQLFARDTAPNGGVLIGTVRADQASEPAISAACRTSGTPHRFSFTLTEAIRRAHPNKKLFAYGVGAGANVLLGQSGQHSIPGWQLLSRRFVYDQYQQLCKTIEPETGATVTEYDDAGNVSWSAAGLALPDAAICNRTEAQASGRVVTRTYDKRNRVKNLSFPGGVGNQLWTYTPDGLPSSVRTSNGSQTGGLGTPLYSGASYNKRRLPTNEGNNDLITSLSDSASYQYDRHGSLSQITYPSTLSIEYLPNALGQPTTVRDTNGAVYASAIGYYPNGALRTFAYGNGVVHTMTQNARQLPLRSVDAGVLDLQTAYDGNGNVGQIKDLGRGDHYTRLMEYDDLDRLQTANSCSFGGDCWHRFSYDAIDNLKSWSLGGVKDHRYYYDARNQLTNIQNAAGASIIGLSYDVQGNLTNKNGSQFQFDYGNRLRKVVGLHYYRYDAQGRRVNVQSSSNTESTLYSGPGQLLSRHQSSTNTRSEYFYLAGSVIAQRDVTPGVDEGGDVVQVKYQHTDALGSPVAVTNQAGQVIDRTDWEPFGSAIAKPAYDGIGYTGHLMDGATGLTYMQQRYYDAQLGRFLSADPVSAYSKPGQNFNRYWYANNNPYGFSDPDGREGAAVTAYVTGNCKHCLGHGPAPAGTFKVMAAAGLLVAGGLLAPELAVGIAANPAAVLATTNVAADLAGVTGVAGGAAVLAKALPTIKILEEAKGAIQFTAQGAKGTIEVISDIAQQGKTLTLSGMHVDGVGKGASSLSELRDVARALGASRGASTVIIQGGQRTTGAKPGKIPIPVKIKVNE
ncbi:RHS repeat-associated core domain protein [Lysobacter capsici]|nr:RHS repeat-associated core domain protein [Lysobacter capsici]